jgi:hypothetical protein
MMERVFDLRVQGFPIVVAWRIATLEAAGVPVCADIDHNARGGCPSGCHDEEEA